MILESQREERRINKPILVTAYTDYLQQPEEVAQFTLELSLRTR